MIQVWNCKWDVFKTVVVHESHKIRMMCWGESPEGTVGYHYCTQKCLQGNVITTAIVRPGCNTDSLKTEFYDVIPPGLQGSLHRRAVGVRI